jgi:hypothetical protein
VPTQLSKEATAVVNRLKQLDGRKRPRKKPGLLNWIKSQCQNMVNGKSPDLVLKKLIEVNQIKESGSAISYEFGGK